MYVSFSELKIKGVFLTIRKLDAGSVVKNLPTSAGDSGSISGSGKSPGKGNGNPLQYSCLGNSMDRGAWQGVIKELNMT